MYSKAIIFPACFQQKFLQLSDSKIIVKALPLPPAGGGDVNDFYILRNWGGLYLLIRVTTVEVCDATDDAQ